MIAYVIIPMLAMVGVREVLVLLMWIEMRVSTIERRRQMDVARRIMVGDRDLLRRLHD